MQARLVKFRSELEARDDKITQLEKENRLVQKKASKYEKAADRVAGVVVVVVVVVAQRLGPCTAPSAASIAW